MAQRKWKGDSLKKYREYQKEFNKKNYIGFSIRLEKQKDKDVIEYLQSRDSITKYIRQLILDDMKKNK